MGKPNLFAKRTFAAPLRGVYGTIVLGGDLREALPWLALAELHGVGQHTAFGMGQVRISWSGNQIALSASQPA